MNRRQLKNKKLYQKIINEIKNILSEAGPSPNPSPSPTPSPSPSPTPSPATSTVPTLGQELAIQLADQLADDLDEMYVTDNQLKSALTKLQGYEKEYGPAGVHEIASKYQEVSGTNPADGLTALGNEVDDIDDWMGGGTKALKSLIKIILVRANSWNMAGSEVRPPLDCAATPNHPFCKAKPGQDTKPDQNITPGPVVTPGPDVPEITPTPTEETYSQGSMKCKKCSDINVGCTGPDVKEIQNALINKLKTIENIGGDPNKPSAKFPLWAQLKQSPEYSESAYGQLTAKAMMLFKEKGQTLVEPPFTPKVGPLTCKALGITSGSKSSSKKSKKKAKPTPTPNDDQKKDSTKADTTDNKTWDFGAENDFSKIDAKQKPEQGEGAKTKDPTRGRGFLTSLMSDMEKEEKKKEEKQKSVKKESKQFNYEDYYDHKREKEANQLFEKLIKKL